MASNTIIKTSIWLDDACKIAICDKINDDDLKFIVESFIEYYSHRHFLDPTLSWNSGNKMNSTRGINGGYNVGAGGYGSNRTNAERDIGVGVVYNVMSLIDIVYLNGACDVGVGGNASRLASRFAMSANEMSKLFPGLCNDSLP